MGPWSAAAVSLASASAAANALHQVTHSLPPLASSFRSLLSDDPAKSADGAVGNAGEAADNPPEENSPESLAAEIRERVESILRMVNLRVPKSNQLDLSPLGNVFIEGQIEDQGEIEARLDADPGLKGLLEKWNRLSGGLPLQL